MSLNAPLRRPLGPVKHALRQSRQQRTCPRCLSTETSPTDLSASHPPIIPPPRKMKSPWRTLNDTTHQMPKIKTLPPPPSIAKTNPFPLLDWQNMHLPTLDPTGARTRLFDRANPDCPKQGDILLTTFKTGDPFSGICLSIRRRGLDTAILLRNRLLMTGVEMWVKIYSPNVKSVEVVKRAEKRARRARLYYLRKPKHDRGSVEGVVEDYLRRRRLIRSGALGVKEPGMSRKNPQQARSGVGAR